MVFLPGDHVLDRNIIVTNVARLTMRRVSSSGNIATVVRNGSVGFSLTNMVDLNIYSLAFTSYNKSWSYGCHPASSSALLLQFTQNVKLVNCSFHDNIGTALVVNNTNLTLTESNEFIHNQCGCESVTNNCNGYGCGITALNSNLTFTGNTTFHENNACYYGGAGAIWASGSSLHLNGTNNFIGNSAEYGSGGAINVETNSSLSFSGSSTFSYNSAEWYGGAIYAEINSSVCFSGTSTFSYNSAYEGGAIYAETNSSVCFSGTSNFSHNSAYEGGAIYTDAIFTLTFNGTNSFVNNSAKGFGGGIHAETNTTLSFNGTSTFSYNPAERYGGAIYVERYSSLRFVGTSTFSYNSASEGGAIFAQTKTSLTFIGTSNFCDNSAQWFGGAIEAYDYTSLHFSGTNNLINNSAVYGGAIDAFMNVVFTFNGINNFTNNSAESGGGAISAVYNISMNFTGTSSFSKNLAVQGGAISATYNSTLTFSENISFTNNGNYSTDNEDSQGGAMYLYINAYFYILPNTTVYWENNHATLGGAIYVFSANPLAYCTQIATFIPKGKCFFQLLGQNLSSGHNLSNGVEIQLIFKNNSADAAGSVLYGGAVDNCKLTGLDSYNSSEVFDMLVHIKKDTDYNTTSNISSEAFRVCPCEADNRPNCSRSMKTLSVYPGETFQVSVVAVGQRNGTVPAQVRSRISNGRLLTSQYVQLTSKTCTTLNYTVFSLQNVSVLELYADGPCSNLGGTLVLRLGINQTCPLGFNISKSERSCVCEPRLIPYTNQCNIINGVGQITRDSDDMFWVGHDQSHELILHPHCPFDYCVNDTVVFPLNNTDIQCAHNRAGILCGACKTDYSLVLGTFQCSKCNKKYYNLTLLIPFALMGVALVFLLFVCKLTVATGTLSGLVFYANIVEDNRNIFLPVESTNGLSIFIAWLNLDFGIETCFYDGMDAYSKTWLQFVFPAYILVLVGFIILISHYSQWFANLLGSNPVSVLATLILLSYAKVIRTVIAAVPFTDILYQDYYRRAWLYDANVDYITGKHFALFLVAVIFFLFFFLSTLLLLFGQWLQAISHLRFFSWVNRLKPFMDSFHAPYKPKHRYWPGLLLVLRFVLLLVFTFNFQRDPSINMLAILLGAGILQLWAWVSGGVYKNWCLDALEGSFALNLILLSAATYHVKLSGGDQRAVGYISVSIALSTFVGVLAYYIFQQLRHTKLWKKMPKLNMKLRFKKLKTKLNIKLSTKETEDNNLTNDLTESVKFDQFREPLLEDPPQPTHSVV